VSKRWDEKNNYQSPGPAFYNQKFYGLTKGTTISKSVADNSIETTPGPGHYQAVFDKNFSGVSFPRYA